MVPTDVSKHTVGQTLLIIKPLKPETSKINVQSQLHCHFQRLWKLIYILTTANLHSLDQHSQAQQFLFLALLNPPYQFWVINPLFRGFSFDPNASATKFIFKKGVHYFGYFNFCLLWTYCTTSHISHEEPSNQQPKYSYHFQNCGMIQETDS